MVGRPREFDIDQALDAAMQAFWAKGYEATSLCDLMTATGLHKGSIYQAFGDKHTLFKQALKRYLEEMRREEIKLLEEAASPREGIVAVGHGLIDMADDDSVCPKGCMAINSLVELAPHDPEVLQILDQHMTIVRESLTDTVRCAQSEGQIGSERPAEIIAAMLMTFIAGLATTMKGHLNKAEAHKLLDAQIAALS